MISRHDGVEDLERQVVARLDRHVASSRVRRWKMIAPEDQAPHEGADARAAIQEPCQSDRMRWPCSVAGGRGARGAAGPSEEQPACRTSDETAPSERERAVRRRARRPSGPTVLLWLTGSASRGRLGTRRLAANRSAAEPSYARGPGGTARRTF